MFATHLCLVTFHVGTGPYFADLLGIETTSLMVTPRHPGSPMSGLPLSATISLKLAPLGIVIGALGCPAYLSLMYLMNSRTRTRPQGTV
jgi:hypothetical protein